MKQARLLITYKCPRTCPGCCNTYSKIMAGAKPLYDINQLKDYDVIMLTGGEPMLFPDRVIKIANILSKVAPKAKIFMYSAWHDSDSDLSRVLSHIDGVHFTLHSQSDDKDIEAFHKFQNVASHYTGKSFRLYVDKALPLELQKKIKIKRSVWTRVEIKPWASEDELLATQPAGIPAGEEMFVLQRPPSQ